ncbi:MAG: aminoglycoside phosphotransferase family protein [Kiritimatiellae bacterium]|nr:aminoglycoside phosphotransferase family protein [Kiritimatiellia bacterium]
MSKDRSDIYYWKCDRASAFHGTSDYLRDQSELASSLAHALERRFGDRISAVAAGSGQGNHRTFTAELDGKRVFIRTEDGAEADNYFAVEAAVTARVAKLGVPVPETIAYDVSREDVPFAWQIIPFIDAPDLNSHFKAGTLDWTDVAPAIGRAIATWQSVTAPGFGPFSAAKAAATGELAALHPTPESYYRLNLAKHVGFLVRNGFLSDAEARSLTGVVDAHVGVLDKPGVLVHKDVALWNVLGTPKSATAFIDWDDAIVGDAMDDLSLMGCFHERDVVRRIVAGYEAVKPLPEDAAPRFWLDLLRNMVFKAVIRVGAGYFKRDAKFFLVAGGGESLEQTTRRKISEALDGLEKGEYFT